MLIGSSIKVLVVVGIAVLIGALVLCRGFAESIRISEVTSEDVFALTPEELAMSVENVVGSMDPGSAARISRYYLNYLSEDKLGCLWMHIAAQLGDKGSEYGLFTEGIEECDVFNAEVLDQCIKKGLPGPICEYVRVNMSRLSGKSVDHSEENLLLKNTSIAKFKEYECKYETSSGRTNSVFIVCRTPRSFKGKISGFVISSLETGIRPEGWLSVLKKYGDEADKDGLLLVNVYWYEKEDATNTAQLKVKIKEVMHQVSTEAGVRYDNQRKKFILGSQKADLVRNALCD